VYTRYKLAEILYCVCSIKPYDESTKDSDEKSLLWWDVQNWEDLIVKLRETQKCIISHDANVNYYGKPKHNVYGLAKHASDPIFNKRFSKIIRLCELNKTMAPIRIALELQQGDDENASLALDVQQLGMIMYVVF
jgi:hypothetical protein